MQSINTGFWATGRRVLPPLLLSRGLILLVGLLALQFGTVQSNGCRISELGWIDMWARWDSGFYLDIAADGYTYIPGEISRVAFFPLYPLLMRWLTLGSTTRVTLTVAGWLISNFSFWLALIGLVRLIELDHPVALARRTTWLLCFFPTSFYFGVVYTESLFLLLTVWAFLLARQQRWGWAGLLGGLGAATRVIGALLILPLALEKIRQKSASLQDWLSLLLVPLGFIAFAVFLTAHFGDPFIFSGAQNAWGRPTSLDGIIGRLGDLAGDPALAVRLLPVWGDIAFTLAAVLVLLWALRRQRLSYLVYVGYSLAVPLSTISVDSIPRYLLVAFPLFIAGATWLDRQPKWVYTVLLAVLALSLALFTTRWTLWFWVA